MIEQILSAPTPPHAFFSILTSFLHVHVCSHAAKQRSSTNGGGPHGSGLSAAGSGLDSSAAIASASLGGNRWGGGGSINAASEGVASVSGGASA